MAYSSHPDNNVISAYVEGGLERGARRGLEAHLSVCTPCRELAACAGIALQHREATRRGGSRWRAPLAVAASAVLVAGVVWWMPKNTTGASRTPAAAPVATLSVRSVHALPAAPVKPTVTTVAAAPPAQWAYVDSPRPTLTAPALPSPPVVNSTGSLDFASLRHGFRDQSNAQSAPRTLVNWGGVTSVQPTVAAAAALMIVPPVQAALPPVAPVEAWPMASGFAGAGPSLSPALSPAPSSPQLAAEFGWAISRGGALLKSVTAGLWREVPFVPGVQVHTIYVRGEHVWAAGNANELFTSTDHGKHWQRVVLPDLPAKAVVLHSIVFLDAQHGVITAGNGQSWTTRDGGQTWVPR